MKHRPAANTGSLVPVPRMLGAFALGGLLAAVAIPAVGGLISDKTDSPGVLALASTWLVMAIISGAYLFPMSVSLDSAATGTASASDAWPFLSSSSSSSSRSH